MRLFTSRILFLIVLAGIYGQAVSRPIRMISLKVDQKTEPNVVGRQPVFSWQMDGSARGLKQVAYRIVVSENKDATAEGRAGNMWDSEKVRSDRSIQVTYRGKPLKPATTYYWKVLVWNNQSLDSVWSNISAFQTGLFDDGDWQGAAWIALEELAADKIDPLPESTKKDTWFGNNRLPIFRKSFHIAKEVQKARLFISGLGHFEASINGQKLGDHFLDAGWVKFDREALYVAFDVTDQLVEGANAIGVMLGNGFYFIPPVKGRFRKQKVTYGYPKMICNLVLEYTDGSREFVVSDQSWKTRSGPITFSSLYGGEDYDARRLAAGWDRSGFDARNWQQVIVVDGPPVLNPQMAEPLKVFNRFEPQHIQMAPNGEWVYDLGQNASGIIELTVTGKAGDTVRVYPAELLNTDGTIDQKATGSPYYFEYVLSGNGEETWQPRFTYYGFRYLQVRGGVPKGRENSLGLPVIANLKGLHTRNAAPEAGRFSCSDELFNRIHALIDWAIRSNMASVFTDCPHREKLGWLEQVHLMGPSMQYRYDISNLAKKTVSDMMYSQLDNGLVPEIAPEYVNFTWGGDMFRDSPEWGSSSIIVPWYLYRWYGDEQILKQAYPMMRRYIAYLQTKADGHILRQGLGDWYDVGPEPPGVSQLTPMGVTGTAIYYGNLGILAEIAKKLGDHQAATAYAALAGEVKTAFNDTFFNPTTKQYATGSQTANAMATYMDLVPAVYRNEVVQHIIDDIRSKGNSLTAGDIGHRYLLQVLEDASFSSVIYDMNSNDSVPGYGYQLARGATALTESWQALPTVSNNHMMLGHLMEWLYGGLAGIDQAASSVAYKSIVIRPNPVGRITYAEAEFESPYGLIRSAWRKEGGKFKLQVIIPPNTEATLYLPGLAEAKVTEGGRGVKNSGYAEDRHIVEVGSGKYEFEVN